MPRDSRLYLDDILEAVTLIRQYVKGLDAEDFASDRKTQDAVIRNLEIIGEAARNVPEELRRLDYLYPEAPLLPCSASGVRKTARRLLLPRNRRPLSKGWGPPHFPSCSNAC